MTADCCPLCGSAEHDVMFDLRTVRSSLSVPGLIARCRRCPMWFKILTERQRVAEAYADSYADTEGMDDYMTGAPARALFRRALREGGGAAPGNALRLLDIGAGQGALVEEAQALGYDASGVDRCEPLVRKAQARGLRVECRPAEDLDTSERFDVVTMMDVIEHVPEPRRLLATAYRLLRTGGRLIVYTPNHRGAVVLLARLLHACGTSGAVREIFGGNHVSFFDDRSLPAALTQEGFAVNAVRLFPYDPARPGGPVSPLSLAAVTAVEWLGRPFHRTFRMLAFATRTA